MRFSKLRCRVVVKKMADEPREQFACLPNAILKNPPIRKRGEGPDAGLSVFEFGVLFGIVMLARTIAFAQSRRDYAWKRGGRAIEKLLPEGQRYERQSRRSFGTYQHHQYKNAGSKAHNAARSNFKLDHPLAVTVSQAELLRAAGLSKDTSHQTLSRRALRAALPRLTKKVVSKLPPLLQDVETLPNGRLRLTVDPKWIPSGRYGRVLWPPPKTGATVLALYLFIAGCNFEANVPSALKRLYRRLGIADTKPSHARRALESALECVNDHLALASNDLDECDFPREFKLKFIRAGRFIRFSPVYSAKERERRAADAELERMRDDGPTKKEKERWAREDEANERWFDEQDRKRKLREEEEERDYYDPGY